MIATTMRSSISEKPFGCLRTVGFPWILPGMVKPAKQQLARHPPAEHPTGDLLIYPAEK
jgi:hypothetical protein